MKERGFERREEKKRSKQRGRQADTKQREAEGEMRKQTEHGDAGRLSRL